MIAAYAAAMSVPGTDSRGLVRDLARTQAMPSREEIRRVRRLIDRVQTSPNTLIIFEVCGGALW
ncbi:hypothetical protein [Streptomyces sp. TLI_55]|uniref:hypothetical protein n=1 Tax=Streptomyces sp. TLI_55 TaxID=1938861 RepID=UPI0015CF6B1F|nr:hypothetical protein [Streptomyces sp. TLI_55]